MMNLKDFFVKLHYYFFTTLHLLTAVFLLSGLFYIRFLPRVSRDLWHNMTVYQILYRLILLGFIISAIIHTLRLIYQIEVKEQSPLLEAYSYPLKVVSNYVYDVLENFYKFIWFVMEKISKRFFNEPCLHFLTLLPLVRSFTNPKYSHYYFWVLFSLKVLPRVIFVMALLYDVFLCKRFDYTFRCIPLLLIPLLEPLFLFILRDYDKTHVFNLASFLTFQDIPGSDQTRTGLSGKEEDLPYGSKNFEDFFYNYFSPVDYILVTLEKYDDWKIEKMKYYQIQLALQILRLSAYTYVLGHGIL